MPIKLLLVAITILLFCGSPGHSQQTTRSTGTVKGLVVCADTHHAARFAMVKLVSATGTMSRSILADIDGTFTVDDVPSGAYYIFSNYPGYVSREREWESRAAGISSPTVDALAELSRSMDIPEAEITPGGQSLINVSLERGAVIGGMILYDDGAIAPGLTVQAFRVPERENLTPQIVASVIADDKGAFRISGLSDGRYLVRAMLPESRGTAQYYGDTSNPRLAKAFSPLL